MFYFSTNIGFSGIVAKLGYSSCESCVIGEKPPTAAEYSSERHVIFVSIYQGYPRLRREGFYLGLCKKVFAAFGGRIFF
jgi:hypothetical protein